MICFRASFNVAQEWYITFSTKRWCKALEGGTVSLKKKGPRRQSRFPSLITLSLQSVLLAMRMWLKWN